MRKKETAGERMEKLLAYIRGKQTISYNDVILFCRETLGVSEQTANNYLSALERAALIRVKPNEITPWDSKSRRA
ncbi:MAG: hypothetical protein ACP5T2_03585 [Thermoprotei archaeon]